MINKVWYKWPQGYYEGKNFLPLYTMVRRIAVTPVQLFGFVFIYLGTLLGYGVNSAESLRRDLF